MKIIGFVGLPGSGKGEASDVARRMGLKVAVMGDVVRREAARLGLEPSDENFGNVGNMLRAREGQSAIARRCLEGLSSGDTAVIDGIRSRDEVDYFRAHSDEFHLIEIWAPPEARLRWITARARPDDPNVQAIREMEEHGAGGDCSRLTAEALEKREARELGWGMSEALSEADQRIINDGDLAHLRRAIEALLSGFLG